MSKKIRGLIVLAIISASMIFAMGCSAGSTGEETTSALENGENAGTDNVAQNEEGTGSGADAAGSTAAGQTENLDSLLGEWVYIASIGEDYYYATVDIESEDTLNIYLEDGIYRADIVDTEGEFGEYGIKIKEVEKPDYPGNDAAPWYAQFATRMDPDRTYDIALLDKDVIKIHVHYPSFYQDEETGENIEDPHDYYMVYVRKDSTDIDDILFKYQYVNTVNVSNISELYEAIDSNTRIILEAGTYNISQLPVEQRHDEDILFLYDEDTGEPVYIDIDKIHVVSVYNLIIEAKEGANVTICTEDPDVAPLSFESCTNVTLSGLTLGHEVEPGQCSGSVVSLNDVNMMTIEDCRLYGSGAHGIDSHYSYDINVNNTEIYECTYGLVDLYNTGNVTFRDCSMHDSTGYDMIDLQNVWNILFDGCSITDNSVNANYGYALIDSNGDNVKFANCHFEGNSYDNFKIGSVEFENCSISD